MLSDIFKVHRNLINYVEKLMLAKQVEVELCRFLSLLQLDAIPNIA